MKNVYLIQANQIYGEKTKSTYIPYAAGCLAAYAWRDERVRKSYRFMRFIYTRENIETAVNSMDNPSIAAFSCSVWNMRYNIAFAKRLKETYPDCTVIFGGHQISADATTLEENRSADILIHNGGEEAFCETLAALDAGIGLLQVNNISYRLDGQLFSTGSVPVTTADYPSPYLDGWFDDILKDGIDFSAIIETNRGCPNRCAFCDWGMLKSKVRLFSLERVMSELKWLSEHKISYVYCADANFGLFDRDVEITREFVRLKEETGYPGKLKVNFTKNRFDVVGEISELLARNGMGKSQTLSFQSLSPQVLENIGRKNMSLDYFRTLIELYNRKKIPTYSELILGLPGETRGSFISGLSSLLEAGQHTCINVYPCELLPNSMMGGVDFVDKYKIAYVEAPFEQYHVIPVSEDGETELSRIIISTSSMTREQWVEAYLFAVCVQAFHCMGLTRYVAVYMRRCHSLSYEDFYTGLIASARKRGSGVIFNSLFALEKRLSAFSVGKLPIAQTDDRFGAITYEPDELLFLSCAYESEDFFKELAQYIAPLCADMTEDILSYQKNMVCLPEAAVDFELHYSFNEWFELFFEGIDRPLTKKNMLVHVSNAKNLTWSDYAREIVWYGRRENATLYSSPIYKITFEGMGQ